MRRRNVKRRKTSSNSGLPPISFGVLIAVAVVAALGYLSLTDRCERAGKRIQELERVRRDTHERLLSEESKWANLKSLKNVERVLRRHGIEMRWPDNRQVVRVYRPTDVPVSMYAEYAHMQGGTRE